MENSSFRFWLLHGGNGVKAISEELCDGIRQLLNTVAVEKAEDPDTHRTYTTINSVKARELLAELGTEEAQQNLLPK
ncbi:MAG: hypothetical protein WC845_00975 [Candidatus Staskawiczbacteria bacterium]|jgi:hypothetical protein